MSDLITILRRPGLTCPDCPGPEDQAPRARWTTRETETAGAAR